jgi:hypothetical protein
MSPTLRPVREIMEKLDPKPGASAVASKGKARRAELADRERAAAVVVRQ